MKTLREFEAKYYFHSYAGCFVYNICHLIEYLELSDVDYFETGDVIKKFATDNNLSIYSAPRETFNIYHAVLDVCKQEKTSGVIVEDLS